MARMIGNIATAQGCAFGKKCTCNGYLRSATMIRVAKRRERQQWKKEIY